MNTFGSDLNKILSAREQAHSEVEVPTDVPVIKADTIKKVKQEETDQKETDQKETDQKETDQKETDQKETDQKESEV